MSGMKIASGATVPGKTKWKAYKRSTRGIYVDVDTCAAGFTKTPVYVASIAGDSHHWETTGGSAIYAATPKGFRIYVRYAGGHKPITPAVANGSSTQWHINWIGVES